NDINNFNEITRNKYQEVKNYLDNYFEKNNIVIENKSSLSVIKKNEKEIVSKSKFALQSLFIEVDYKYNGDIKKFYLGSENISTITSKLTKIFDFCSNIAKKHQERGKNEISESIINNIIDVKNSVENLLKSKIDIQSKIKIDSSNLSKTLNDLRKSFSILKKLIETESVINKSLNFRLYFPVIKTKKKNQLITIIDEMSFDIFLKLSDVPTELKTEKIYKEWHKELENLFYKKRESEYLSIKMADELIIDKYKK
ncbi:hypothetical protein JXR93_08005, partial [bacterium]|nr:hypothetical protein [bacterium]